MADQVVLKHLREAIGRVPLDRLEIELRMNGQLTEAAFATLERRLASSTKWEATVDSTTCDQTVGDVRVTDGTTAVRKRKLATSDCNIFRVVTSDEERVPVPAAPLSLTGPAAFQRVKVRRVRSFAGWSVVLTKVNPDSERPGFEVEVELDNLWLVRRPLDWLARTGTGLAEDVARLAAP